MKLKQIIALITVAALIFISVAVNVVWSFVTTDFSTAMEEMQEEALASTGMKVIEKGDAMNRIAVLEVDGAIQDLGATGMFSSGYDHTFFMKQLQDIREDESVKGIVLAVNSPGGGVLESADIYDALIAIQEEREIPIYVSMGGMAASGGYYISAPADKIFVNRETITGSIGVIMQALNYSELAEKVGISFNTIKSGEFKDMMSPNRAMTDRERNLLQEMLNDSYERFVEIIAEGREMSVADVKKVADGRIMNGRQAIEAGLADDFGKREEVIEALKADFGLENAQVFSYSQNQGFASLFGLKMQQMLRPDFESQMVAKLLSDNGAPRMMYLYGEY